MSDMDGKRTDGYCEGCGRTDPFGNWNHWACSVPDKCECGSVLVGGGWCQSLRTHGAHLVAHTTQEGKG